MEIKEILKRFDNYLKVEGVRSNYPDQISRYLKYCTEKNINYSDVDVSILREYILMLREEKNHKNTSINLFINALRKFYKFLYDENLCDKKSKKATYKLRILKVETTAKDYITKADLDDLIEMFIWDRPNIQYEQVKAVLYFMYFTGVRISEIVNLKRSDVFLDKDPCEAIIRRRKNNEDLIVLFPKEVGKIVNTYFVMANEELNAFNLTEARVRYWVRQMSTFIVKNKKITPHSLRHSFAKMLVRSNMNIRNAQKLLGHKNIQSTLIYYNTDIEIARSAYKELIQLKGDKV